MINLRNSPFLWLALVLLVAFVFGERFTHSNHLHFQWGLALVFSILLGGAVLKYDPHRIYIPTISLTLLVWVAGIWRLMDFNAGQYPVAPLSSPIKMEGLFRIEQVLKSKSALVSLQCKAVSLAPVEDSITILFKDQFILLQIRNPCSTTFFPGDRIQTIAWVSPIGPPMNPDAFDARVYYKTLGLRHQASCKGDDIELLLPLSFSIFRMTAKWQAKLSNIVKLHTRPAVAQVINALVWGDRSDMDAEIRDAFADSGAMHVLSVSGMHVAMIYSMLFLLFGAPGDGVFLKRICRFILYATAILLYVGLTGACAAVVRAGWMILLFLFGKTMGWNTQVWNLLGFAAFIMLWLNPPVYLNIGFQLSFMAMAGILLFAKPIIRSLTFKTKLLHWIWEIIALSLAAQVFIVPTLLSQFHQFPLTFMISSIVAIPAGYIIIFGAIINVILSALGIDWLWPLLDYSGHYFILSMKWMAALNPSMNYSMPPLSAWFLILMSLVFTAALLYDWPRGKQVGYVFGLASILVLIFHRHSEWNKKELIIYHAFKGSLIDVSSNGFCYVIRNGDLTPTQIEFATRGHRCSRDMIAEQTFTSQDSISAKLLSLQNSLLNFEDYVLLYYTSGTTFPGQNFSHVLIGDGENLNEIKALTCQHQEALVILPACLSAKIKNQLVRFFKANDIRFYDIASSGYFKLTG